MTHSEAPAMADMLSVPFVDPPTPVQPPRTPKATSKSAGRCCTQCGATRTPQWREGPMGPKTLCNACGVKLQRQLKAAQKKKQPHSPAARHQANGDGDDAYVAVHLTPNPRIPPLARPVRKAAVRAAELTAEYATNNDWNDDDEDDGAPHGAKKRHRRGDSSESKQNSDWAEEVAWAPLKVPMPASAQPEATAAVDLLSMSVSPPELLSCARVDTSVDICDLKRKFKKLESQFDSLSQQQRAECLALKQLLEAKQHAAQQARASMADLAKQFASRQAVCIHANRQVLQAAARLRSHLSAIQTHVHQHLPSSSSQPPAYFTLPSHPQ